MQQRVDIRNYVLHYLWSQLKLPPFVVQVFSLSYKYLLFCLVIFSALLYKYLLSCTGICLFCKGMFFVVQVFSLLYWYFLLFFTVINKQKIKRVYKICLFGLFFPPNASKVKKHSLKYTMYYTYIPFLVLHCIVQPGKFVHFLKVLLHFTAG